MALTQTMVSQLYVAIFNRASEGSGNAFWQTYADAGTAATEMLATTDAQEYFGDSLDSNQAFVEHIYLNTLNKTVEDDPDGIAFWVELLDSGASRGDTVATLVAAIESYGPDGENYDPDDAATVAAYNQFVNRVAVSNYMADEVENPPANYAQSTAFDKDLVVTDDADTVTSAKAAVDELANPPQPPVAGEEYFLTADQDIVDGTANDDMFYADVVQVGGPQVNSLATGDRLDGGAGSDALEAQITTGLFMGDTNMPIQPRIKDIEEIKLEALNNDMYQEIAKPTLNAEVYYNAKNTYGLDAMWSWYSDANLTIQDLNTMTAEGDHDIARNTSDMTIGMGYTGGQDSRWDASDLHVYFDQDFLLTGQQAASQAIYYLLDQDADLFNRDIDGDGVVDLLAQINASGLRFTVDGVQQVIEFDKALLNPANPDRILNHVDFVEALQPALAQLIADGLVPADTTLTVNPAMTDFTFLDDGSRSSDIPAIVLETETDAILESIGFRWVDDLVGEYNVYGRLESEAEVAPEPLSVQVALEKVGRGGLGGELIIGSMDKYHHGIDDFYVTVYGDAATDTANGRPSSLSRLDSTGNALDRIFITSDNTGYPGDTYADLTIGNGLIAGNPVNDDMTLIQSNGFMGNLSLGTSNATRVNDLATLDTTDMAGNTTFWAELVDRGLYDYQTGSGNDTVNVLFNGPVFAGDAVDTIYTGLSIETNAGNDTILVGATADPQNGVSQLTMLELQNLTIDAGTGDDYVEINNNFRFHIDASAGSDWVYINSTVNAPLGGPAGFGNTGTWIVSAPTGPSTFNDRVLYQAKLTVSFAGFENTVAVETDAAGNFIADQLAINAAIKEAIDGNPELARLLEYTDSTADQRLIITSTVDGANELAIDLYQPQLVTAGGAVVAGQVNLTTADVTPLLTGIIATDATQNSLTNPLTYVNGNWGSLNADGTAPVAPVLWNGQPVNLVNNFEDAASGSDAVGFANVNFSIIDMGDGANDLVVFDSNDASANILVIDEIFGKVSVVNFFDDAALNTVGLHAVDYTYYLDNQVDPTTNTPANTLSAVPVAITLDTTLDPTIAAVIDANEVKMIRMVETAAETFDGLSASDLVTALNGNGTTDNYANINNAIDAVANTTNLVGNVQDHIFMVENANNRGEYKVFYLTSTVDTTTNTTGGEFDTVATELGTLDFGNSINFNLVGQAGWNALYSGWHAIADGAEAIEMFTMTANAPEVEEGDDGTTAMVFDLELDVAPTEDVTFNVETSGGTATSGEDYQPLASTVTFAAGETTAQVSVNVIGDTDFEADETVQLTVSGEQLEQTLVAVGTILNDDPEPGVVTDITLDDLETVDVSDAAYNVIVDFAAPGVKLGNIVGFGDDDLITFTNAPEGSVANFDSSTVDSLDFGFGSFFDNVWVMGLLELDESLVSDVMAESDATNQIEVLGSVWGDDWFVVA